MQTQGSLQEANLASLLQTMQSERATGTLALENGSAKCSLYFLFGHLFHASDASRQGEEVVVDALTWADGNFQFDPRAKLPAEETIKSSPADLIAEAQQRGPVAVAAVPAEAPETMAAAPAAADAASPAGDFGAWAAPAAAVDPDTAPSPDDAPYQSLPTDWSTPPAEVATEAPVDPGVTSWAAPAEVPETPAAMTTEAPVDPATAWPAAPAEASEAPTYAGWQAGAVPAIDTPVADTPVEIAPAWSPPPAAEEPAAVTTAPPAATSAVPTAVMYPLPSGKTTYEGLKSAFVDFPKLLRTLKADTHTGYVHLTGDAFSGTLIFQVGQLVEALADANGQVDQGDAAFQQFRQQMDAGVGHLDVVELSEDLVAAVGQLFTAPQMFSGLLGRFIDFEALIDYLEEEKVTGSVVITDTTEMGVILLRDGAVLGAYTETSRTPDTKLTLVSGLAKERKAGIEVRSGGGATSGIDIETQLAQPL